MLASLDLKTNDPAHKRRARAIGQRASAYVVPKGLQLVSLKRLNLVDSYRHLVCSHAIEDTDTDALMGGEVQRFTE